MHVIVLLQYKLANGIAQLWGVKPVWITCHHGKLTNFSIQFACYNFSLINKVQHKWRSRKKKTKNTRLKTTFNLFIFILYLFIFFITQSTRSLHIASAWQLDLSSVGIDLKERGGDNLTSSVVLRCHILTTNNIHWHSLHTVGSLFSTFV